MLRKLQFITEKDQLNSFHCQKERNSLKSKVALLVNTVLFLCNELDYLRAITMSKDQQYLCMTLWEQGYIYDLKTMDEVLTYEVDCTIMNLLNNHYSKCSKL